MRFRCRRLYNNVTNPVNDEHGPARLSFRTNRTFVTVRQRPPSDRQAPSKRWETIPMTVRRVDQIAAQRETVLVNELIKNRKLAECTIPTA